MGLLILLVRASSFSLSLRLGVLLAMDRGGSGTKDSAHACGARTASAQASHDTGWRAEVIYCIYLF